MVVKTIKIEIESALTFIKLNLKAAAELRTAFTLQVFGMMLNNMAFVTIWLFFSHAFGEVNGWGQAEIIMLQGVVAFVFGFCFAFGYGSRNLPDIIHKGIFDNLLLSPRILYIRIIVNKMTISALGDIGFGIILISVAAIIMKITVIQILIIMLTIPAAILIMTNIAMFTSMIAFLLPDANEIAKSLFEIFLGPSLYPGGLYSGNLRFIFMFVIPSLFIGAFPVEIVRDSNLKGVVLIWGFAIFWTVVAVKTLSKATKYYESSNLIGARSH